MMLENEKQGLNLNEGLEIGIGERGLEFFLCCVCG